MLYEVITLLAAMSASMLLLLWILQLEGFLNVGGRYGVAGWHAHEMIFGYTAAVIAGFLLTAVRNWTRLPTASGLRLVALVGLWLAGRVVMLAAGLLPTITVAIIDSAFLPLLAVSLVPSLWRAQAWRNLILIGLIGVLALANIEVHLQALNMIVITSYSIHYTKLYDVKASSATSMTTATNTGFNKGCILARR